MTNEDDNDELSFSESFLLTSLNCTQDNCQDDKSYQFATSWLDAAEQFIRDQESSGILTALSNAGQGIESTSILLVAYNSITNNIKKLLSLLNIIKNDDDDDDNTKTAATSDSTCDDGRKEISLSPTLWNAITTNSTLYVHAIVLRQEKQKTTI